MPSKKKAGIKFIRPGTDEIGFLKEPYYLNKRYR